MPDDSVDKALAGAKDTLAKANKFTESVTGNATNAFAPVHHEFAKASYAMPHKSRTADRDQEAKSLGEGLKARTEQNETARKALE